MSQRALDGTVIDGCYRITGVIGEGQFGVVYRCEDLNLKRQLALKMMRVDVAGVVECESAIEEARRLATLNHSNVVQVYRLGMHEGAPFIAMEYIDGRTLRAILADGRLEVADCVRIMRQVAAGLRAIHAMGLLHRDLSTNNVMVTGTGTAKILDFGLSRATSRGITSAESQNALEGTLPYVAPEIVAGRRADVRSEVFSFGVILYEMLAARHPFQAEHFMTLLFNITNREAESLATLAPGCPPRLVALVERCMQKQPAERPAGMEEVERLLASALSRPELESAGTTPAPARRAPRDAPGNPYLNRVMIKRPEDFFGRRQEVKRIFARLNATPPGSVSIVGDRKIGKSSLLNHVYMRRQRQHHLEAPENMIMVFLDLQREKGMSMEAFVRVMLGITNYELRGRLDVSDCALSLDGVKDMVERLGGAGFRLAILLDEFDIVTTNRNFDLEFFSFLRFLANHYDVAYLTSSARDLQVLCHTKAISDSPFFNIFSTMRLSAFAPAEAAELVTVPSAAAGHPLGPYVDEVLAMSGLFPFYIQMACSHACEWLEEHADSARPDFAEIRRRFYDEARLHFRYVWDNFDDAERLVVQRVAKRRGIPDSHQHVLQELAARNLVRTDGDGPRLFAPTFEEFASTEGGQEAPTSLIGRLFGRRRGQ